MRHTILSLAMDRLSSAFAVIQASASGGRPFCCTSPARLPIEGAVVFGEVKTAWREVNVLHCRLRDGNLLVSLPNGRFKATYYKPAGRPYLILRERTKTDDHELPGRCISDCSC